MCFFAAPQLKTPTDQVPTFDGIKLGVSLGSQFQECPWNPRKPGDIPKYCFVGPSGDFGFLPGFRYPQVVSVPLIELIPLKDAEGNVLTPKPFPGAPRAFTLVLVPASAQLVDGTIEEVTLFYDPAEGEGVRNTLLEKYGTSHPPDNNLLEKYGTIHQPDKKTSPKKLEKSSKIKFISWDVWNTGWGELFLVVADKYVRVNARTQKLILRENKEGQ
jgi:hypothetical protein